MPRVFDNIDQDLLPALRQALGLSERADFCAGYFNLRGWRAVDDLVAPWSGGEGSAARVLVGMQRLDEEQFQALHAIVKEPEPDQGKVARLKKEIVQKFRHQLTVGMPTAEDEAGLRRLAAQLRARKVIIKLFLRHPLHAKLYLLFRRDPFNPIIGFLGSSNLTLPGLSGQGELNIDVPDTDATQKLAAWFEDRWQDQWAVDISLELAQIIEESWAREEPVPPYLIYLKMAYHLSREAREGISEFKLPPELQKKLLPFQQAAVKIAAHHLNKRNGVMVADVVGLGKTLVATAVARIFEDVYDLETLILCPKNLVPMWKGHRETYHLRGKVLSLSLATRELPEKTARYRLVVIDESHNLRNPEGQIYRAVREYIQRNDSKCVLLTATPYNKSFFDLSGQLQLFMPDDLVLPIGPERLLRDIGETEFIRRHQCAVRSIRAFEQSVHVEDWQELLRLYMIRRPH